MSMPQPMGPLGQRATSIPLPVAPAGPSQPGTLQHIIASALLGLAAGLGPRSAVGRGLSGGLLENEQFARQAREQAFRDQQLQYHQQQEELLRQAQIGEIARKNEDIQQQKRAGMLDTIAKTVPTFDTKADYDRFMDQTGNLLVNSGFRDLSPMFLRGQFPFRPPDAKTRAETALKKFFASPFTQDLIKQNGPMSIANTKLDMGKDANGRPNPSIPVLEALKLTGSEFPLNMDTSIPLEKLPEAGQHIQAAKQEFFNEHGRKPTSKDDPEIYQRARAMMQNKDEAALEAAKAQREATLELTQQRLKDAREKAAGEKISDAGVDYAATQYRITGRMPSLGMNNPTARASIINRTAEQAQALGQSPAVAIQKQAAFKADTTALTRMRTMSASAEAFETKALAQADIVNDLSTKVSRTQYPIINDGLLTFKARVRGDANTQLLYNALTTFTTEYAKILEGATGSAAGASQSARESAAKLVSAGLNKGTLAQTIELMKKEMRLTIDGYGATVDHITERMGGQSQTPPTPAAEPGRFTIVPKGR